MLAEPLEPKQPLGSYTLSLCYTGRSVHGLRQLTNDPHNRVNIIFQPVDLCLLSPAVSAYTVLY